MIKMSINVVLNDILKFVYCCRFVIGIFYDFYDDIIIIVL